MSDSVWVVPATANLKALMAQIILNAQVTSAGADNSAALLTNWVNIVRGNIQRGGMTPLSQTAGTVPPGAERYCYVLTVNDLTAGTPNLGTVVVTMNGGVTSPWLESVKAAKAYVDSLLAKPVEYPSLPVQTGTGWNFARGQTYDTTPQFTMTNVLELGRQYYYNPGPNEASLICGSTTLTAAGSFYASSTTFQVTGAVGVSGFAFTGTLQRSKDAANQSDARRIRGRYDMTTFGPFDSYWDQTQDQNHLGTL